MKTFEQFLIGRPNTIKTQISLYRYHIKPYLKKDEAKDISKQKIESIYNKWAKKNLSPSTMKLLLVTLRKYVEWAGGSPPNLRKYSSHIGRSRQQGEPKCLSKDQSLKLLTTLKQENPILHLICLFGLHAGLRRGEIFGLKWSDINLGNGTLIVKRSFTGPTKSGKSRKVPIGNTLLDTLLELYTNTQPSNNSAILTHQFDPNPGIATICKSLGFPVITIHGLRHTFATLALESGKSPKLVSQTLGHANLSTTLDIYWNSTAELLDLDFLE